MDIPVNILGKQEFLTQFHRDPAAFLDRVNEPEAFVVQRFFPREKILSLRDAVWTKSKQTEPSWHALKDGCPDYHRTHDEYPGAYVKARYHAFYHHTQFAENAELVSLFHEVFELKDILSGGSTAGALSNPPSAGLVARINFHQYPSGGGYQEEHIDPAGAHARIQTLVVASEPSKDFQQGGLYARRKVGSPKVYMDAHTSPGDLLLLSPGIPHGVDPIDPDRELDWALRKGGG